MKKIILAISIFFTSYILASDIKPVPFVGVKSESAEYSAICNYVKKYCGKNNHDKIWKKKNNPDEIFIVTSSRILVRIKSGAGYSVSQVWDFSDYTMKDSLDDDGEDLSDSGINIFPALYPLSETKNAVALVQKWSTSYSGGGKEMDLADFIMLNEDGTYKTVFSKIPFYSRERIKACFSDSDYAKKLHCYDESWSILDISIIDNGSEFYSWELITTSYNWPAFVDKSKMKKDIDKKLLYPFKMLENASIG
ncbi:hypothetical protein [Shimwellia blattae]|uniref:Secreted protein n=1 Tax=Shimwellia blattae (strain ATCC 29907 / DSM 4481 / JCM 1650 / NBRC 105725 / CDC 9005-74) TaxID=630626 RepID=I2B6X4_SHIBC|nr:hypothetical protein [Shimwellia blattae]AFJ46278.1 hypothetical protein EBL_c11740 [Shimwellia blattae DSM 4481 = NBRC 105725]GAB83028.1 hypothetical protein EB105725_40_00290 [Shimwellia blattae DSM 4481 = NBRC 105725]VDY63743.1 Uncharacterised protein [Shimwellia blattae]VEC21885.1 Uncharacterised protein [Shimwellia blattae]